jgi:hypothetical protein
MSKTTSLAEIISTPTSENSWVNGAFKAIVTNTKSPNGKMPGRATLTDPDNASITLEATFWQRDPSPYEGKIAQFSGPGMKKGDYKDKPQLAVNAKTRVDVFQDGEPGKHMPIKPVAATAAAPGKVAGDFQEQITQIGQTWLHSLRTALQVKEIALLSFQYELTDEQFQSCVSSIFIEANRKGLGTPPPLKAIGSAPVATPPPAPKQVEDQDNPF